MNLLFPTENLRLYNQVQNVAKSGNIVAKSGKRWENNGKIVAKTGGKWQNSGIIVAKTGKIPRGTSTFLIAKRP